MFIRDKAAYEAQILLKSENYFLSVYCRGNVKRLFVIFLLKQTNITSLSHLSHNFLSLMIHTSQLCNMLVFPCVSSVSWFNKLNRKKKNIQTVVHFRNFILLLFPIFCFSGICFCRDYWITFSDLERSLGFKSCLNMAIWIPCPSW